MGENQYLSKYSEQLVELMQPVALSANKELYSAQYNKIAKTLEAEVARGAMTAAEAQSYANQAFQMYMDPTGTLSNGSVLQKWSTINAIQSGDINNPAAYVSNLIGNTKTALSWGGGNTIARNIISSNILGDATAHRKVNDEKLVTSEGIKVDGSDEQLELFNKLVSNADDFNTNTDKWEKWMENSTKDIAEIKTWLTKDGWEIAKFIVEGIIGGITAWLGTKVISGVIGKGIGKLAGADVGGTGAGMLAGGSTAGIALGIISTTALAAIGATVAQKEADKSSNKHGAEIVDETLSSIGITGEAAKLSSNKTIGALVGALNDRGGFQKGWGNVSSGTGMLFSKIFQGESDQAKNYIQWMLTSDIFEHLNDTSKYVALLTLAMEYANQNKLDAFNKGIQEFGQKDFSIASNKDLGEAVMASGLDKSYFEKMGKKLKEAGWNLNGKMFEDIDANKFGLKGVNGFRQGLAKVPYDDYPAILHEGEAVLTSSTANELRNLLTEYRANNQAVITLDTTIQNQTVELVAKLDEVITAINSSGTIGATSTTSIDQANAIQKLQYSMTHLVSTKSALN